VRTLLQEILELLDAKDSVPLDGPLLENAPPIRVIPWLDWYCYRRELNSPISLSVAARDCGHFTADCAMAKSASL